MACLTLEFARKWAAPCDQSEQEIAGYRDALQLIHESHADMRFTEKVVRQWLEYFWGMLIRAYGEFETRVESLRGSKTDQVQAAVARRVGPFGIADIEHDCPGVSRDMVRHVLRQMRSEGRVRVEGRGRGARWRAT